MRPFITSIGAILTTVGLAAEPSLPDRPTMRQFDNGNAATKPPSQRQLVDARKELKARFREPLSHTETSVGAMQAVETLLIAAVTEPDRQLKWLMLAEARRLATAAGNAAAITRSIKLADALYEFDALELELRSLTEIPLRSLDHGRAAAVASVAETLATRAEADARLTVAISAQTLAVRAWQRARDKGAAQRAAARHDALEITRLGK
ncbi:MAG: hypothetical protein NTY87_12205 [Planctomycetia bacterium]|nr:hypothetical protein [Planctomycetia bacterium]